MKTYQDIKSTVHIDSMTAYAETLLDMRFKRIKKYRYNAICPFHAGTEDQYGIPWQREDID